jgi:putative hydrolases of HD superfamily
MDREIADFAANIVKLKQVARKGWVSQVGVAAPESVADHSFGCAVLAMCLGDLKGLDTEKLIRLALLHDLHEVLIGDYDAFDKQQIGVAQAKQNQQQAINDVFAALPEAIREGYVSLAEEYLHQETPEAKLVKQIDKLDMIMQALQYEKQGYDNSKLQVFWDSVGGTLTDPDLKAIFALLKESKNNGVF